MHGFRPSMVETKIQLVHPLTKESVATSNQGGGNWGAKDGADTNQLQTILAEEYQTTVQKSAESAARIKATGKVRVPEDYSTISEALDAAFKDRTIDTIVLGAGEHRVEADEDGENYVPIYYPIIIVGDGDKNDVVVVGGFYITTRSEGNVRGYT